MAAAPRILQTQIRRPQLSRPFRSTNLITRLLHALLANDISNQTFCIGNGVADPKMLHAALDWACGLGKVECSAIRQGQPFDEPDNVIAHSTYTFDSYYHKKGKTLDSCDLNGVVTISTTDPRVQNTSYRSEVNKLEVIFW
ncbi:glucan endo-1,3-beta-glucosidase 3-like [Arachis stenosperma]|uniref:glucan endo-1,3-beta-glucosidase 3-like n=1 Tax=Arachis stenosperma TaxID=217475 RepID=UPI0025AD207F|nr:glucan endo-1,3-beta-glucosidase 3-like [Arachis stenosperma]